MVTLPAASIAGLFAGLRVEGTGPLVLEVGRLEVHDLVVRLRMQDGVLRLDAVDAARVDVSGVKTQGAAPVPPDSRQAGDASTTWSLAPLATAEGAIEAEIVDATLLFDADVKVPIRQGRVDFNEATVAHVGPDSRMGVSRLGIYVDAPNGRSYLYQFPSTPVDGVEFERPGALPGPWGTKRGSLQLQPFAEWLLRQAAGGPMLGLTEQARQLLARTAVKGFVQLADGPLAAPGVHAELVDGGKGRNAVRLHSPAVGRGIDLDVAALSVRNARASVGALQFSCESMEGALVLKAVADEAQWSGELRVAKMILSGVRVQAP